MKKVANIMTQSPLVIHHYNFVTNITVAWFFISHETWKSGILGHFLIPHAYRTGKAGQSGNNFVNYQYVCLYTKNTNIFQKIYLLEIFDLSTLTDSSVLILVLVDEQFQLTKEKFTKTSTAMKSISLMCQLLWVHQERF